jgi:hypothetical protein
MPDVRRKINIKEPVMLHPDFVCLSDASKHEYLNLASIARVEAVDNPPNRPGPAVNLTFLDGSGRLYFGPAARMILSRIDPDVFDPMSLEDIPDDHLNPRGA